MCPRTAALALVFCLSAGVAPADERSLNPQVEKIISQVSETNIRTIIAKLVSFGTRNTFSNPDFPDHGIGAARQWIFNQFKSYSPRLEVRFDKFRVRKHGPRIFKDVDLYNIVAVLPGKSITEAQVLVTAHYDSLNLGSRPLTAADYQENAELPAPGACDDASGVAAVMELARIMSQYEFDKTLVFIAFAGEEEGLVGGALEAAKMKKEDRAVEAVLNNDLIGTDVAGNGRIGNSALSVYSNEVMDSSSQELARYTRQIGERYFPAMNIDPIFLEDRVGRGGDHTPFQWEGFAAVRLSTPNENYANQHRVTDTLENMSVPYTAMVAKVNAAVAAALALAPRPPIVTREPRADGAAASGRPSRPLPMLGRGNGYDAVLQWRPAGSEDGIRGYAIVIRPTTSAFWEREIFVGKVDTYTLPDVSIDNLRFGVKAIGNDGSESLVAPYVYPARQKIVYETVR